MSAKGLGLYAPDRHRGAVGDIDSLGRPDYSYRYVERYFYEALASHVPVVELERTRTRDPDRLDLLFVPPHRLPAASVPGQPAVDVFAWEFDTIPTEVWNNEPANDWRNPLGTVAGAIVHSRFAADAVSAVLPPGYPVASIPAPVWESFAGVRDTPATRSVKLRGWVIDSHAVGLDRSFRAALPGSGIGERTVHLSGDVYTAVLNPDDERKNWVEIFSAFTDAFRGDRERTLVMKLVHPDAQRAYDIVTDMLFRPAPFQCRVIVIFGYLDGPSYTELIRATSYAVNASSGEGQCLPLMEFMSAGVPAVAPNHTAMAEYVNESNSFVVSSTRQWARWPHDPRRRLRCLAFRPRWESLRHAFERSRFISPGTGAYEGMSRSASDAVRSFASRVVFLDAMRGFMSEVGGPEITLPSPSSAMRRRRPGR